MIDIIKSSFRSLLRKKHRSILTLLGISIGVASVIIISNIGEMGTSAVNLELDSLGLSGLSISAEENSTTLSEDELNIIKNIDHVQQASPVVLESTDAYTRGEQVKTLLWGIDSNANQVISLKLLHGRYINKSDINSANYVCMVDEKFSYSLYDRDNIVGKTIDIRCGGDIQKYKVVGIIKTGSGLLQNMIGDYIPNFIYAPYTTVQETSGKTSFDQIAVKLDEKDNLESTGDHIVSRLLASKGMSEGYYANNLSKQKDGLAKLLNIITLVISAVGVISLVVASLSIMTVMLVSVNERTREIGIKKSIGATQKTIMLEFMMEALWLSIIGFLIGAVIAISISFIGAHYAGLSPRINFSMLFICLLISLFTGTTFGVYPATKAAKLKPVDALRTV